MPTNRDIRALQNANKRRRTPRIVKVEYDPGNQVNLFFDRVMDAVPTVGENVLIRVCDGAAGNIVTFQGGSWLTNPQRYSSDDVVSTVPGYVGPTFVVHLRGNLRANARFRVSLGARCDRVEPA